MNTKSEIVAELTKAELAETEFIDTEFTAADFVAVEDGDDGNGDDAPEAEIYPLIALAPPPSALSIIDAASQ